jgi:hypothetical protein
VRDFRAQHCYGSVLPKSLVPKYVFLSNLGQKLTFSVSVSKVTFAANLVELSSSGSVQSATLCQLQEEGLPEQGFGEDLSF